MPCYGQPRICYAAIYARLPPLAKPDSARSPGLQVTFRASRLRLLDAILLTFIYELEVLDIIIRRSRLGRLEDA